MSTLRNLTHLRLPLRPSTLTKPFTPLTKATYSTIPNTKNSPQGPNKPASETSGTSAQSSKTSADMESGQDASPDNADGKGPMKKEEESTSDSRHPAKQPDSQEKPTRSTGIGGDRAVSSREGSG